MQRQGLAVADKAVFHTPPVLAGQPRICTLGLQTGFVLSGSAWSLSPRPPSLPTPTQAQPCFAPLLCDWWGGLCAFWWQELDRVFIPSTGYFSVVFLLSGSRRFVSESEMTHCQVGSASALTCCLHCLGMD